MNTKQYTIRNIPEQLDQKLRKRAELSGKSLNQIVLEDIASQNNTSLTAQPNTVLQNLDWFVGLGPLEADVLQALEQDDIVQKELMRREFESTI
jgi:hypothetical protein